MASTTDTIEHGAWIDYSPSGGLSYGAGGTIAGSALATFETNMGKQCSIVHVTGYWGAGSTTVGAAWSTFQARCDTLLSAGRDVLMEWSPWDYPTHTGTYAMRPSQVAAGAWDTYITQFATDIKAWGKPITLRMLHEANLPVGSTPEFPWQHGHNGSFTIAANQFGSNPAYTNTTADVKNAWIRIVNIFKNVVVVPNVAFVWCPNIASNGDLATYADMYPGSAYVDWLGLDGYGYRAEMTMRDIFRGGTGSWGGGTGLQDSYALITALGASLPLMVCETGMDCQPTAVNVSTITTNGTTWTVALATAPSPALAVNQGVYFQSQVPTGYRGMYTIASVTDTTHFTIANTTQPGALTTAGTAAVWDRIARATAATQSFEIDIPAMPRFKRIVWFWVAYADLTNMHTFDYDGTQPNNIDMVALRNAVGGSHYLAGNQMGANLATRSPVPFQDQPMTASIGQERLLAVLKSSTGLTALWNFTDATSPFTDRSGRGHSGSVVGALTLNAANVVPAESAWNSVSFPGTIGNYISVPDSDDFSIVTTNKYSIVVAYILPTTLASGRVYISNKGAGATFEHDVYIESGNSIGLLLRTAAGGTFCQLATTPTGANAVHLVIFTVDLSLTNPIKVYVDGGAALNSGASAGTIGGNGANVLALGQRSDGTAGTQLAAGSRIGLYGTFNTVLSAQSAANIYSAFVASPIISAVSVAPSSTFADITFTTDDAGSTAIEWGATTAYGSIVTKPARVTSHAATASALSAATTYHYRPRTRNTAGTETIGTDQTFTTQSSAPGQSLQAYIDATATSGICALPANVTFREAATIARAMTVNIPPSTRLCGSDDWSIGGRSGCTWAGTGPYTSSLTVPAMDAGATADGSTGADWRMTEPCKVFIDGVLQVQLQTGTPAAGQWVFDVSRHVLLGTAPTGHLIEVVTRQVILTVTGSNVTIQSDTPGQYAPIEHCGSSYQRGAINLLNDGVNTLTLKGLRLAWMHAYAISIQGNNSGHVVDGCWTYETGQGALNGGSSGAWGSQARSGSITVRNCLFERNNINRGWTGGWDAGLKIVCRTGVLLERNYTRDWNSVGFWLDNDGNGAASGTIQDNYMSNIAGAAIMIEIQGEGASQSIVRRNKISKAAWGSGTVSGGWRFDAGILLSSSVYVDVADNIVAWSKYAYSLIWKNRLAHEVPDNSATHITAERNVAIHQWTAQAFTVGSTGDSAGMTETATDSTTNGTPFIGWLDPDNTTASALFSDVSNTGTGWQVWASTDGTTAIADATSNTRFAYNNIESNSAATFSATRWGSSTTTLATAAKTTTLDGTADPAGFTGQYLDGVAMPATYSNSGAWPITVTSAMQLLVVS